MRIREVVDKAETEEAREIVFSLMIKRLKPVFASQKNTTNDRFSCMLDTGAGIPVWCTGVETLKETFSKAIAKPTLKSVLSGFGIGCEIGEVYYIPSIELSNGKDSVIFKEVYLPVVNKGTFGADLILPSSILKNCNILLSQNEKIRKKELFFQGRSLQFKMNYTKRRLSFEDVAVLQKMLKTQEITIDTSFLGEENEFKETLI